MRKSFDSIYCWSGIMNIHTINFRKVKDTKGVISSRSTKHYKKTRDQVLQIGKQLSMYSISITVIVVVVNIVVIYLRSNVENKTIWFETLPKQNKEPSWSWSYGSWIYNYRCNQCLSPLQLWVWTRILRGNSIQHYAITFGSDLQ
jgi:hypothetical protein